LEQPAVAVRVAEQGERAVVATFRIAAMGLSQVIGVEEHSAHAVEDLADVAAAGDELGAGGFDLETTNLSWWT
jgi:hypothetical protein